MSGIALSVVIPAWNEELRLPGTLARITSFLAPRGQAFEVLVADVGSTDGTARVVETLNSPAVRLLRSAANRGKGHAVRRGMLEATGAYRLMTDADLSTPIEDLPRLEQALAGGVGVAIGSRAVPGSSVLVRQGAFREAMGRLFNLAVRVLLLPDLRDTQCGFKLFTARAARDAFAITRLEGFCFDVEALVAARAHGHGIVEVPVTWRNDAATRVGLAKGARAFLDLVEIRRRRGRGAYAG
ncbi:MAG TPA: dolichyl-phosphate beta-glucosyltransferase [Vicinamibacteria bacterium]